ncbi:MAG: S8 family serine peptidase [Deltaproteobacteria bacterium]
MAVSKQYILLPREGLRADFGEALESLASLPGVVSTEKPRLLSFGYADGREIRVLDSVAENGPKLIEMDAAAASAVNSTRSPLRAYPLVEYDRPDPKPRLLGGSRAGLAAATQVTMTVTNAQSGGAVAGAHIVAFTDFARRQGDEGRTDSTGRTLLNLSGGSIERLYCYPPDHYWSAYREALPIQPTMALSLEPIDLTFTDCVRHYYANSRFTPDTGVLVGVIDTGVGPHPHLNLVGGRNTVTGEPRDDFADGDIHGTHVAGLIGANGAPPDGLRGVAPGVPIRSYRVFGADSSGATNYAILKAMILAANDGCDIINLSLGGGPFDDIVREAVVDARNNGMLVVVAAGNDGRKPVNYPAAYAGATAVSAMGIEGTFPTGTVEESDILRPPNSNHFPQEFIAAFSNMGSQIMVTGLGVGALSTLPPDGYGPMSGTSMAAPVVAGAAVCLLSRDPAIYGMQRDPDRSIAIERLLQTNCVKRGFGLVYEGFGLPDPATV